MINQGRDIDYRHLEEKSLSHAVLVPERCRFISSKLCGKKKPNVLMVLRSCTTTKQGILQQSLSCCCTSAKNKKKVNESNTV